VPPVTDQNRGDEENEEEGGEKDPHGGDDGAPEPGDEVADERRRDDDGTGADHPDRNRHQELPLIEPAGLLDEALLQKGHDDEPAAERQRARFEKEDRQSAQDRFEMARARRTTE